MRDELPTRDYAALVAVFNGVLAATLLARKCSQEPLPERIDPQDIALLALATQKLSRVITKDKVTAALRAPFTEIEGKGGAGELEERGDLVRPQKRPRRHQDDRSSSATQLRIASRR